MSNTKKQLWAVEVMGPDDWFAARSLKDAREKAAELNAAIIKHGHDDEFEPNCWAIPRAVDWTEDQHEASLKLQDEEAARIALIGERECGRRG
jgi:hypothetical protein